MTPETFSVIIPNWNGARYLPACLDSLRAQTLQPLEVLLVDNASTDDSLQLVRSGYPEASVIPLSQNRGFTAAVNAGVARARGTFVALLNQDAQASPQWVQELTRVAQAHPEVGGIASKILLADKRDHFHSAGDEYGVDGIGINRGVWQQDEGQYDREEAVFGACGGAAAYRRNAFIQVGGFDETLFMYYEDVDVAWRLQIAGWPAMYAPGAVVFHQLSSGGGTTASYYGGRNTLYVLAKDVPWPLLRRHWTSILAAQCRITADALRTWRGAAARARLRGQCAGLWTWPRMWSKRRSVQRSRTVTLAYLESLLVTKDTRSPGP
jgi:GT2 family glycosyltransferase